MLDQGAVSESQQIQEECEVLRVKLFIHAINRSIKRP